MPSLLLTIVISISVAYWRWRWRHCRRRAVVANVFLWAVILNYVWEVGQLPLFAGFANFHLFAALRHCAWYTFGDATIILCLYALGAWGHGSWGWGLRLRWVDWLWLPLTGMLVAIVMERFALDVGRWQYGPHMPLLPGVDVGVLPVVQMGLLPLFSVLLAGRLVPLSHREVSPTATGEPMD